MSLRSTWGVAAVVVSSTFAVACGSPEPCSAGVASSCLYSCEHNDGPSCAKLGAMSESGTYTDGNAHDAVAYYVRACKLGEARGCHMAGLKYTLGIGTPTDLSLAATAFGMGCNLESADSCAMLGAVRSLSQPSAANVDSLQQSCSRGSADGCALLAVAFAKGIGVPVDLDQAASSYQQACKLGDSAACVKCEAGGCDRKDTEKLAPTK